ncbi:MAG TPA: alkaline phosphatase PhoX [Gemmatimonadales bacterium]|nr:alkaline phosphatase PhoX [Gemmatimonadales bacterium]
MLSRRAFVRRTSSIGGLLLSAPSLSGLISCAVGGVAQPARGYGPLQPSEDYPDILSLPAGFRAKLLSRAGDPLPGGGTVPHAFDGMGAFQTGPGRVRLVRNHEVRDAAASGTRPFGVGDAYDPLGPAGTMTLEVRVAPDGAAEPLREFPSLLGTYVNCAGGVTPWGSWLTCEETVAGRAHGWTRSHGYVFEVPARADGPVAPVPLREMGRFSHEAVAVDPRTGYVYETEDARPAGFYRFRPKVSGRLSEGGALEMLAVDGRPRYDTRTGQRLGVRLPVRWIPIPEPDADEPALRPDFVYSQGFARGGATFARLEGCWFGDAGIFFNATDGGDAGAGQVWHYRPDEEELVLVFESPGHAVLSHPDNVCVSPRGGVLLCEDGDGPNLVRGLTRTGELFDLVRNELNDSEWAGACFSPQGRTLFVNLQGNTRPLERPDDPQRGMTFAIWGPWEEGAA